MDWRVVGRRHLTSHVAEMATGWCVRIQPDYMPSLGREDQFWVSYAEYSAEGRGKVEHCKVKTARDGGLQPVENGAHGTRTCIKRKKIDYGKFFDLILCRKMCLQLDSKRSKSAHSRILRKRHFSHFSS